MSPEKLKKGNNLSDSIQELKAHQEAFKEPREYWTSPLTMNFYAGGYKDEVLLKAAFLNMDEFVLGYKARLQSEITKLEKELEAL